MLTLGRRIGAVLAIASICAAQNSTSASTTATSTNLATTSPPLLPTTINTINETTTIAPSGNNSVEQCMASHEEWSSSSSNYEGTTTWYRTTTETSTWTSTIFRNVTWECTRTCAELNSQFISACYAGPTTVTESTTVIYQTSTYTRTSTDTYASPTPDCSIEPSVCMSLSESWSSSSTGMPPRCTACTSTACTFQWGGVDLYFWPVTTSVSRNYCVVTPEGGPVGSSTFNPDVNHTFVPTTTGPYTVVDGITMYQGNVYLSVHEPFVLDNCREQVTRARPGSNVLTIASSDLYSIRGYPHNMVPWSVNYDDFNEPVPFSAWKGQKNCMIPFDCTVVFPGEYRPFMSMPPQIRNLDPNWANCAYDQNAMFDPPIALNSIGGIISSPTPPSTPEPITEPPTPGQSGSNGPGPTPPPNDPPTNDPPSDPPTDDPPTNDPPSDPPTNNPPNNPPNNPSPNDPPNNPSPNDPSPNDPSPNNPSPNNPSPNNPSPNNPSPNNPSPNNPSPNNPSPNNPSPNNPSPNNPSPNDPSPNNPPSNDPATNPPGATPGQNLPQNPGPNPTDPAANNPPAITIGSTVLTVDPTGGGLVINPSSTLSVGAPPVTVGDQTISVGSSGIVVIGPSGTSTIPGTAPTTQLITVGGETLTMVNSELVIGPGTTVGPGDPAVTVDGTTFSVGTSGVVVSSSNGGTTIVPTATSTGAGQEFTGGAAQKMHKKNAWSLAGLVAVAVLLG